MFKLMLYPLILFSALLVAKEEDNKEEENKIKTEVNKFVDAWNKHDAQTVSDYWDDDGDLIDSWGRVFKNKKEVSKNIANEFATRMKDSTNTLTVEYVRFVKPDIAFVDADSVISGMVGDGGTKYAPLHIHVVFLLTKKDNGKWLILAARPY